MSMEAPDDTILYGSDAEVEALILQTPKPRTLGAIIFLSGRFVAKAYKPEDFTDARRAIEIAQTLGIRTPRLIRSIQSSKTEFLIMERIDGRTLEDAWPGLGWYTSFLLAFQLRRFISSMRSFTSDSAGSLVTGSCRSFWLDDRFGLPARAAIGSVMDFLAFWAEFRSIRREYQKNRDEHAALKRSTDLEAKSFVLTHHDLAPRN